MCRYYSYLNKGLALHFNGRRYISKNGLLDLLAEAMSEEPLYPCLLYTSIQPVPGQPGHVQGMQLLPDGRAVSINMHTLLYLSLIHIYTRYSNSK